MANGGTYHPPSPQHTRDVMSGTTSVECPNCGHRQHLGFFYGEFTFSGNFMNVAVDCLRCGATFDATGGGDGTFAVIGGRLMRVWRGMQVASDVSRWDREELLELRDELARLLDQDRVDESNIPEPVARYKPKDPAELQGYLRIIATLLTLLLASRLMPMTQAECQSIVEEAIQTVESESESGPSVGPREEQPRQEYGEKREEEVPGQQPSDQDGGVDND